MAMMWNFVGISKNVTYYECILVEIKHIRSKLHSYYLVMLLASIRKVKYFKERMHYMFFPETFVLCKICSQNYWVFGLCPSSGIVKNWRTQCFGNWVWFIQKSKGIHFMHLLHEIYVILYTVSAVGVKWISFWSIQPLCYIQLQLNFVTYLWVVRDPKMSMGYDRCITLSLKPWFIWYV
jgi:hypothetical protein